MSAFIICWLPFFVLALLRPLFLQGKVFTFFWVLPSKGVPKRKFQSVVMIFRWILDYEIPEWISSLFLWLGYANSALNPVIYATLNRDFRRPFREILCCRCATLDDLMRKEFYDTQYGRDDQCERSKQKVKAAARLGNVHFNQSAELNGIEESEGEDVVGWSPTCWRSRRQPEVDVRN